MSASDRKRVIFHGAVVILVVVEHLATTPNIMTAWRGIAETIKALFGRS